VDNLIQNLQNSLGVDVAVAAVAVLVVVLVVLVVLLLFDLVALSPVVL
jgi:hypothetical protein